jgi:hypothetical protein
MQDDIDRSGECEARPRRKRYGAELLTGGASCDCDRISRGEERRPAYAWESALPRIHALCSPVAATYTSGPALPLVRRPCCGRGGRSGVRARRPLHLSLATARHGPVGLKYKAGPKWSGDKQITPIFQGIFFFAEHFKEIINSSCSKKKDSST